MDGDRPPVFRIAHRVAGSGNRGACDPGVCNRAGDTSQDVVVEPEDMSAAAGRGHAQNGV